MFEQYITAAMRLFSDYQIQKVNVVELDMRSTDFCVLGQIYGSYWEGVDWLNLTDNACVLYGLSAHPDTTTYREDYAMLTEEWKHALTMHQRSLSETGHRAKDREVWGDA